MANLSKELCEICGIEPKRVRPFLCDKNKENIPCEVCIEKHGKCHSQKEIYPDFERPENFVRLLNLPTETIIKNGQTIPAKNIWWIVNMDAKNCKALAPYYFENLLIQLIVILENKYKIHSDEFINSIKQSIRETEWVYE